MTATAPTSTIDHREVDPELRAPAGRTKLYIFEVAELLGSSKPHVVNLIDSGQLEAINIGSGVRRHLMVTVQAYYRFLLSRNTLRNPQ
jgi:excisionase family DNA binding protein